MRCMFYNFHIYIGDAVSIYIYGTFYEKMTPVDFFQVFKFTNFLLGTKTLYKTALTHIKLDYLS